MKKVFLVFLMMASMSSFAQVNYNAAFSNSYENEAKKDYTAAINALTSLNADNHYFVQLRLGWLYYNSLKYATALEAYNKAVVLKPTSIEALLGVANSYSALQKWEDMYKTYEKILALDPNNTVANYRIGLSNYYLKKFDVAESYASKVVKFYPFDYDGNLLMAGIKFAQGKLKEAKSYYESVLLSSPNDKVATEMIKAL